MIDIWSRKFELAGIDPSVVLRLGDYLVWDHPPTLPQIMESLAELQDDRSREMKAQMAERALPAPSELADPNSPVVIAAREELKRFIASRRMPS